jgi:shikimate 5-dehydrogenase
MKNKIFFIFLNLFSTLTFAQLKTFTIEYNCVLTLKQKISGNDSLKILINNDTLKKPKDLSMKLPKSINMKVILMSETTIGNSNESKIIINNTNSGWKNKEEITLFDSIVFKNQK